MPDTPVTFTYKGTTYSGILSEVTGGGQLLWHLYVDRFYWGQLRLTKDGFVFDSNQFPELKDRAEEFGEVVRAWMG